MVHANIVLGAVIGRGAFGVVHKARDDVHPELAVKVISRMPTDSDVVWAKSKADLLKEAQRLQEASHDRIVRVHNLFHRTQDDAIWLVMDYCSGGSLLIPYMAGPMPLSLVRRIIADACEGLHAIHSRGMIHRDIKPGNILTQGGRYKIGDFGLVTNDIIKGYATQAGYLTHLAPEVFRDAVTSSATDIWALGMTIYRLLHGDAYFQQNISRFGEAEIIAGKFSNRLPWLAHIPTVWIKKIRKAMHDDPHMRYKDAMEMAQAFAAIPITSDWQCVYAPFRTLWTMPRRGRLWEVEHRIISPRKHEWAAVNKGSGKLPLIRLGGSATVIPRGKAAKALSNFFATNE